MFSFKQIHLYYRIMDDRKRYIVVHKDKTPFSQVVNDCETGFCVPVSKGENLNSVVKKLCTYINKKFATVTADNSRVYNEDLYGEKDGYNAVFLSPEPFYKKTTAIFVNGQRMKLNFDYEETTSQQITFNFPIHAEDQLIIDYNKII